MLDPVVLWSTSHWKTLRPRTYIQHMFDTDMQSFRTYTKHGIQSFNRGEYHKSQFLKITCSIACIHFCTFFSRGIHGGTEAQNGGRGVTSKHWAQQRNGHLSSCRSFCHRQPTSSNCEPQSDCFSSLENTWYVLAQNDLLARRPLPRVMWFASFSHESQKSGKS